MSRTRWGGSESRRARAQWEATVRAGGVICCRCKRPIIDDPRLPGGGWQPDHWPIRREAGGTQTHPAHTRCNLSDGGRRGAAITNARRHQPRRDRDRARNIRGI